MLPVIALVGRPNVGKSTLFNRLTRTSAALVSDWPGLTRDRQYGFGKVGPVDYLVVDTGGLGDNRDGIDGLVANQTLRAVEEADVVLLLVDGREGVTVADENITDALRRGGSSVVLIVNKTEGQLPDLACAEFHTLGLGEPMAISSAHGDHVPELMERVLQGFSTVQIHETDAETIRVAVIGRPNVGKSTLINRLLGEERVVASEHPGTTRDSIDIPFHRAGR